MSLPVVDTRNRPLHDLRISITDRCNFRCTYCMPGRSSARLRLPAARRLLTFEEITRLARIFIGAGGARRSASPAASRWCAATWNSWSACWRRLDGAARSDADHQRLPAGAQGAGAQGGGTAADHGQPGLAGQRGVPAMNDVGFPVERVLEGIEAARDGGPLADQDQHGGQAGRRTKTWSCHGPALPRDRPHPALHRVHGRRKHERLAAWTMWCPPPRSCG